MTAVEIAVRGSHTLTLPAETGTVHAMINGEGPEPQPVFDAVAQALAEVTGLLESRLHPKEGPVTKLVIDQVRRGSHRPFDRDGKQLPMVHTASVTVRAVFTDFDDLADWVESSAGIPGFGIGHIEWALTDTSRLRAERKARRKAVRDALRRAQDYADALALGSVSVRAINDPGLSGPRVRPRVMMAKSMSAPIEAAPGISLLPDDVDVAAEVEATFVVSPGR